MASLSPQLLTLAAAWLAYCAIHSLLASLWLKERVAERWPQAMAAYRLAFNVTAVVLIIPLLWLTYTLDGPWLWRWQGPWGWLADGIALAAVAGFLWSLRYYDTQEFLGLRQWRERATSVLDQERFHISPLHRYVRHPWYFLALLILWSRDMNPAWLAVTVLASAYFVVGSRLEEAKLLRYHGEVYARYRARVPGLIPLPWRHLDPQEAEALSARAGDRGRASAD